jgi:hypothetical protein
VMLRTVLSSFSYKLVFGFAGAKLEKFFVILAK